MIVIPETHEAWLEARKFGIGASDSSSIIGRSKWKSNTELWEEKTGLRTPEDIGGKPQVKYGHDAEEYIRGLFALDHPEMKLTYESPYKIIRSDEHPEIFCTPDGELEEISTGRHGGLEIKTTEIMSSTQWSEWKDRIPDNYYCQCLHQMTAAGWEFVWLCARIKWHDRNGNLRSDTREYLIERAEVEEDRLELEKATIEFWKCVQEKRKPHLILPEI